MERGDVVVDVDEIWKALSLQQMRDKPEELLPLVLATRDFIINRLRRTSDIKRAWIVTTESRVEKRDEILPDLPRTEVVIETPAHICFDRLSKFTDGRDKTLWRELILRWWRNYERKATAIVVHDDA